MTEITISTPDELIEFTETTNYPFETYVRIFEKMRGRGIVFFYDTEKTKQFLIYAIIKFRDTGVVGIFLEDPWDDNNFDTWIAEKKEKEEPDEYGFYR